MKRKNNFNGPRRNKSYDIGRRKSTPRRKVVSTELARKFTRTILVKQAP